LANKPRHWQSVSLMSVDDKKCKIDEEMTIDIYMNRLLMSSPPSKDIDNQLMFI